MDETKKYKISIPGTGHAPHVLKNADDPDEKIYLCSCGGTKNSNGFCDGTHRKKLEESCDCSFCKTKEERVQK